MGKILDSIDDDTRAFVVRQHIFFVATAPSGREGHVNLSPKGHDSLRVLGPKRIAYVDFPGSGIETVAHLHDNGRIVVTFVAFEGPPKIVRLYGQGNVVEPRDHEFATLLEHFAPRLHVRSIISVDIERVAS